MTTIINKITTGKPITVVKVQQGPAKATETTISELVDVNIANKSNGDILKYDSGTSKYLHTYLNTAIVPEDSSGTYRYFTASLADSAAKNALIGGAGITFSSDSGRIAITATGVDSAQYGSISLVPVLKINSRGQIDSAGQVAISGVTGFTYDSSNANLAITTTSGTTFTDNINLQPFSTANLSENATNKYYTKTRTDSDISAKVIKSFIDPLGINATLLGGRDSDFYRAYGNLSGTPNILDSADILFNLALDSADIIHLADSDYVNKIMLTEV